MIHHLVAKLYHLPYHLVATVFTKLPTVNMQKQPWATLLTFAAAPGKAKSLTAKPAVCGCQCGCQQLNVHFPLFPQAFLDLTRSPFERRSLMMMIIIIFRPLSERVELLVSMMVFLGVIEAGRQHGMYQPHIALKFVV